MLATGDEGRDILDSMERDRREAEYYLLHYEAELKDYTASRSQLFDNPPAPDENRGIKGNLPGRPTETKALALVSHDETCPRWKWLKAVEIVQRGLGERKNIFISIRRRAETESRRSPVKGRPAWVVYTQQHYAQAIESRFLQGCGYVSEKTVRLWWQEIVSRVVEVYLRLG